MIVTSCPWAASVGLMSGRLGDRVGRVVSVSMVAEFGLTVEPPGKMWKEGILSKARSE